MRYIKMKMLFRRLFLYFKNMKWMVLIPLIMADVLVPILAYFSYIVEDIDFVTVVMLSSYILIPLSSCIWSLFILKEYVEGKGNELLYVGKNKVKLLDCLIPFLLFFVTIIIQFSFYIKIDNVFKFEIIRMFFVCFLYFSLTYCFAFLTKSIPLTLMALIIYDVLNVVFGLRMKNAFLIYYSVNPFNQTVFYSQILAIFLLSLALLGAGILLNKHISKFN